MLGVADNLVRYVAQFPIDDDFLPREKLDLAEKTNSSLYPWRGQFSPGLVDLLLNTYANENTVVLDPFVGSGTTLFEAARRGLEGYGAEINPAAVQLASMVRFASLDQQARQRILRSAEELFGRHLGAFLPMDLFSHREIADLNNDASVSIEPLLHEAGQDVLLHNFVVTTLMLALGNGDALRPASLQSALLKNRLAVTNMPTSPRACEVLSRDARDLPLQDGIIDLVITSPPYINVFNYHQNFRKAMELMGWRPLQVAKSEIGSNRKHRGNRFMTVVQYCMDLSQALAELRRLLVFEGVAVFVIGRESRVRDVPFYNGRLLALAAVGEDAFRLKRWQERRFTNRFGKHIYEDIITLLPAARAGGTPTIEFGRSVGAQALIQARRDATGEIRKDIEQALERVDDIEPSPPSTVSNQSTLMPR